MNRGAQPRTLPSPPHAEETLRACAATTVRSVSYTLSIQTSERVEIHNLTPQIRALVAESRIQEGMVSVASFHTTTAIVVNENQAALLEDIRSFLDNLLPRAAYYRHNDPALSDCERHNADAHLKAVLLGQSTLLPVLNGSPLLGQWQSLLFVEFDGPQSRTVRVQVFGTQPSGKDEG